MTLFTSVYHVQYALYYPWFVVSFAALSLIEWLARTKPPTWVFEASKSPTTDFADVQIVPGANLDVSRPAIICERERKLRRVVAPLL